jgi:hypothetical protein
MTDHTTKIWTAANRPEGPTGLWSIWFRAIAVFSVYHAVAVIVNAITNFLSTSGRNIVNDAIAIIVEPVRNASFRTWQCRGAIGLWNAIRTGACSRRAKALPTPQVTS